jgi:hypothetical protein
VYEDVVWKFYGPAAAVGKCAGEMQLIVDHEAAVEAAVRKEKAAARKLRDLTQAMTQCVEEATARLAAANDVQDSGDMKEEGETGDEEQEAEEKGGEVKEQAGLSSPARESGGGCACSFSSSPVDRAPAKRERKMSDEEQQDVTKRLMSSLQQGMDVHSSGEEGGEEEERVILASVGTTDEELQH